MSDFTLSKRPGSPRWYIVWSDDGRSKRRSTGTASRREAEEYLKAFRLELARTPEADPHDVLIVAVLNEYIDAHAFKLPSAPTARIARDHLAAFYGTARVSKINLATHDQYEAKRRAEGVGNETINRERMVLRAALNRAVKVGHLRHAPHVPTLPAGQPRQRFLTRQEAAKLLRACHLPHLALFVRLGLYTAARPGAILGLTWERVDLKNRLIDFELPQRTGNKRRTVIPVRGALYTALARAKRRARTKWVIEFNGARVRSIKTAWRKAIRATKLKDVVRYTLRHTAATWAARQVPIYEVAKLLGNRVSMAERYAKHQPEYLRAATDALLRGAPNQRQTTKRGVVRKVLKV
jgi:integrase